MSKCHNTVEEQKPGIRKVGIFIKYIRGEF
jgi:hypothetical protein